MVKRKYSDNNEFEGLSKLTTIVADTGDIEAIKKYEPTDATTNPSLIYKAAIMPEYASLVDDAVAYAKKKLPKGSNSEQLSLAMDKLCVGIGSGERSGERRVIV